jgi:DNA polymerase-3 subunit delta'
VIDLHNVENVSSPLPWHSQEWEHLNEQLRNGQLPHALILAGGQYQGKAQLALALSRLLLCAETEGTFNCGQCHACQLSARGSHGDFKWVQPEEKSRSIKIDQVRNVVLFSNKTAGLGLRKVIVLTPADSMNVNAFNALLKSLEEPAKDTYLILVCHRMYAVPATIRSRCQILRLPMPSAEESCKWLDKTTSDRKESEMLLFLADSRPLLAQELYVTGGAEMFSARRKSLQALLNGTITVPQAGALWGDAEIATFLDDLAMDLQRLLNSLSREQLKTKHGREAFGLTDEVARLQRAVSAGANPNKQLLVEALLSRAHRELGGGLLGGKV